jgi:hypothetical protein
MENQPKFCNETQIDILRQVFTLTALQGFKEEVFQSRYACSVFYQEVELFNALANFQITRNTSLIVYAICNAIKSKNTELAMKLISRIAPSVSEEIEKMNPNKIYYKFMRFIPVYVTAIRNENIEIIEKMLKFPISEKMKQKLFSFAITKIIGTILCTLC